MRELIAASIRFAGTAFGGLVIGALVAFKLVPTMKENFVQPLAEAILDERLPDKAAVLLSFTPTWMCMIAIAVAISFFIASFVDPYGSDQDYED